MNHLSGALFIIIHLNQSTNYKSKGETITLLFAGRGVFKALQMLMEIENINIKHLMWVPCKLWDKHVRVRARTGWNIAK